MDDPKRALYCLDWDEVGEELDIWGFDGYQDYRYVDIILVPCNYLHTSYGWTEDRIAEECVHDRDQIEDYLKNIRAYVYISVQKFE